MIRGFFGDVGSGKTLTMTRYAYLYYKLGYTIYSNYHLEFPHKKVDKEFLKTIVKEDRDFDGKTLFVLDEIGMYVDSRRSGSKDNVIISYFIKQIRKKDIEILYSEQMRHAVDKRLRGLTKTEIVCKCKEIHIYTNKEEFKITLIYITILVNGKQTTRKRFLGNKYFNLYDTKELITE